MTKASFWINTTALYSFIGGGLALTSATSHGELGANIAVPAVAYELLAALLFFLTGAGLLRRCNWSRITAQIVGALQIYFSVLSALQPALGNYPPVPSSWQFYLLCGGGIAVGAGLLMVFHLPKTRAAFTSPPVD